MLFLMIYQDNKDSIYVAYKVKQMSQKRIKGSESCRDSKEIP